MFANLNRGVVVAVGAGVAIGVCSTWIILRMTSAVDSNIELLLDKVEKLEKELEDLKIQLLEKGKTKRNTEVLGFVSTDDDDDFQEAVEGFDHIQDLNGRNNFDVKPAVKQKDDSSIRNSANETESKTNATVKLEKGSFEDIDRLLDGVDDEKKKVYKWLHQAYYKNANNCNFLWRYAKATYNVGLINGANGDDKSKKELTFKALDLVTRALKIDDNNPSAHKWFAITVGSAGDYLSTQERIKNGYTFKEHIEKAIHLNPKDASAYYLLGRWCYGVYMLSWVERKAASVLFAQPPTSTVDEALKNFQKAQDLQETDWKENMLFLAKCYIEKKNYDVAAKWLHRANEVPTISVDDKIAQSEVTTLLDTYGGYI